MRHVQMRQIWAGLGFIVLLAAGCGSDGDSNGAGSNAVVASDSDSQSQDEPDGSDEPDAGSVAAAPGDIEPEASGELAMDTLRIGSDVWERTLPMTSGQCFLQAADGVLAESAVVWGTANGDDEISFSAGLNQDGTYEARITNNATYFWIAGPRNSLVDELSVSLDYDAQTISGSGVFTNANTNTSAHGSFAFACSE